MAQKLLANANAVLDCTENGTAIVSVPSTKVKLSNSPALNALSVILVTGASKDGCNAATGPGFFTPSSTKVKIEGSLAIREGDEATINVIGVKGTAACNFDVTVSFKNDDVGQTKVKGE